MVKQGDKQSEPFLQFAYFEMVKLLYFLGDYSLSLVYWDKLYTPTLQDKSFSAQLLNLRGILHCDQLDFSASISYLKRASQQLNQLPDVDPSLIGEVNNNLSFAYQKNNDFPNARLYGEQARETFDQLYKSTQAPYFLQEWSNIQANLVEIYGKLGMAAQANKAFADAYESGVRAWGTTKHPRIAQIYYFRAKNRFAAKDHTLALDDIRQAIRCLDRYADENTVFSVRNSVISDPLMLMDNLGLRAAILSASGNAGDRDEALVAYQQIDSVASNIMNAYRGAGSKYTLLQKTRNYYEQACKTALAAHEATRDDRWLEKAYQFASKNKALILVQGIHDESAKKFAGVPEKTLNEERKLKKAIYDLETQLQSSGEQSARDSLFLLKNQYYKLVESFETDYPAYYNLKFADLAPVDLRDIRSGLKDGELLVEYFFGDKDVYVFSLAGKGGIRVNPVPKTKALIQALKTFRDGATSAAPGDHTEFRNAAFQVYDQLLRPALENRSASYQKLVIIPDEELLTITFDALLTAPVAADQTQNLPYLLKDYSIRYIYANRLLPATSKLNRQRKKASRLFAGFGLEYDDFTLNGLEKVLGFPLDSLFANRFAGKLEYSDDEVMEVANLLGGQSWVNNQATLQNFLKQAPDYQIIHLAMHNVVNEDNPLNSTLIFSKTADSTDFLLKTADLFWLPLNADLAVLSACNTGKDIDDRGSGFRSMAGGFLYAGCEGIVASIWNASDRSSRDILIYFYKYLEEGRSKDDALRLAKLKYLEEAPPSFTHPFYWSHFAFIGNPAPISFSGSPAKKVLWIALVAGIMALAGIAFFRNKGKTAA
ncbi:MAG TPA: CHAT domain-containing protein [Flavilitoribacter sp.]|nr:CHAT domain-containing protein [Flavilitoribacter sp.]HMQ87621.1 CHAT domain-containing protein [Flavilitoribacter sp.]